MNNTANIADIGFDTASERPWWSVHPGLIAALTLLVVVLVTLLSRPEAVERTLRFAGL